MHDLGGTIREKKPADTLKMLDPLMLEPFGITRVADVTGLDIIGIPVAIAVRPNSKILTTSQGKGISKDLASISAIMESIESWHAESLPPPALCGSYNQLKDNYPLVALDYLISGFVEEPSPLDSDVDWIETFDLVTQQPIYVPYASLSLDTTLSIKGQNLFSSTSNGLAAGNTKEEAICHSLFELIERDCSYDKGKNTEEQDNACRVIIDSISSAHNIELIKAIKDAKLELYIWDITNSMGVPAYYAEIDDKYHARDLGLFAGIGCHLAKEVALSRAITEAIQSRLTLISGARDDIMPSFYESNQSRHADYTKNEVLDFNKDHNEKMPKTFKDFIDYTIDIVQQHDLKTISIYDHQRDNINVPVVHGIIPGIKFEWKSHRMVKK